MWIAILFLFLLWIETGMQDRYYVSLRENEKKHLPKASIERYVAIVITLFMSSENINFRLPNVDIRFNMLIFNIQVFRSHIILYITQFVNVKDFQFRSSKLIFANWKWRWKSERQPNVLKVYIYNNYAVCTPIIVMVLVRK